MPSPPPDDTPATEADGSRAFFCPVCGGDRRGRPVRPPGLAARILGRLTERASRRALRCERCGTVVDGEALDVPTTAEVARRLDLAVRHLVVAILDGGRLVGQDEERTAVATVERFAIGPYDAGDLRDDLDRLSPAAFDSAVRDAAEVLDLHGREGLLRAAALLARADARPIGRRELRVLRRATTALGLSTAHARGVLADAGINIRARRRPHPDAD